MRAPVRSQTFGGDSMRASITVAVKRQLTVTTLLLLTACSGCTSAMTASQFEAPIIRFPTMPRALATTTCSVNNLPIILIDTATFASPDVEIVIAHEKVHADRAYRYRGGCWPFMYRVNRDKAFRAKEQLLAFCEAGRFAIRRDRNPETVWLYIQNVMRPDTVLTNRDNCLFEPWEKP